MPDNLPEKKELKLTEKYAMNKGQISLIGALWFYLSLYYILELPKDVFNPKKQRELIASNTALAENNAESQKKSVGN